MVWFAFSPQLFWLSDLRVPRPDRKAEKIPEGHPETYVIHHVLPAHHDCEQVLCYARSSQNELTSERQSAKFAFWFSFAMLLLLVI